MDMDNEFLPVPTKEKKSYEVDYDSLGQQSVEKLIALEVDHICGIFGVDVSYLRDRSGQPLTYSFHRINCLGGHGQPFAAVYEVE